jgi:phosphomannomutase
MLTASHNPGNYNGLKWMPYWGGAATPAVTEDIERRIELLGTHAVRSMATDRSLRESWIETADFRDAYFKQLTSLLDLQALKKSRLKVGVDSMFGSARGYLRPFIEEKLGLQVMGIHEERDVLFGGRSPEPTQSSLQELALLMKKHKLDIGLACDGDGDRFGLLDAGGTWISANDALALIFEHLVVNRGWSGKMARSVMTSHFVDAVAKSHGMETRETPVGFKYIGEHLRSGQFMLGGEESGGLSVRGHVPEKDGVLACLLALELVAMEKKPLAKIKERLFKRVGSFFNSRINQELERPRDVVELEERLRAKPPLDLAGGSVWRIDHSDGFKFIMRDGSWLGLRSSGTEAVFRIYAEASTPKKLDALLEAGKKLAKGKF